LAAVRIDLVGTTADFRHFGPRSPLPINHLLCENRRTAGRIGEVRLEEVGKQFSVTRERIRQIEAKTLRKLKHPHHSRKLRSFLDI
jgi:hypothetical protein